MGNTASKPRVGCTLQVIGVGLPRTGTASLCAALERLYQGPVYHGGTQMVNNPPSHVRTWISIIERTTVGQPHSDEDRKFIMSNIQHLMTGFVGCVDMPCIFFIEELLELYPDAKVVCTVRDPDSWWASLAPIEAGNWSLRSFVLWPLPTFRWFNTYRWALDTGRRKELYYKPGESQSPSRQMYERHMDYLQRVVPANKLCFFDVRDGWEPLCKILNKPVPLDASFPRLNEAENRDRIIRMLFWMGYAAWAGILIVIGTAIHFGLRFMKKI